MEEKAATDEMTGLYNKNKLLATIEKRTYDYQQVAIVYWDINRLKYVNDTYGHFAGDQMIVKVAQSIRIALGDAGWHSGMVEMKCLRSFREEPAKLRKR